MDRRVITILLADDDEDDRLITLTALEHARVANEFHTVRDGVELLEYLQRRGPYSEPGAAPRPDLILLDLNMPRMNGAEALGEIKRDPALRSIPVVVLTTSDDEADIAKVNEMGASAYVTKPVTFNELVDVMRGLSRYWIEIVEAP